MSTTIQQGDTDAGAGNHLPVWLLAMSGIFTAVATAISMMSIVLQLKNYRKPTLQRAVVRIMVMVPLYAISSLIALFSLDAAFFIDAIRDLYEAFVIYTFLQLLITYLGGERSLLIILHGRPPIAHPFPVNIFLQPMDVSDPWVLLNLKRGVLQYVQVKPLLVLVVIALKATGTYQEGRFATDSGYTYVSIAYNASICLSLYCLAMFWVAVNKDLKPFRPVPKFLCVKGILFFSFWQSIGISLLVAMGAIKKVGPYTDPEHMSLALVDSLICFEMPIFAIAHQYAFQASDYIDHNLIYAARLPFIYAFRDAFGFKDVWQDTIDTFKGRGVSYQAYEPAEGGLHYGVGRQKRIRAGLRYAKGGKQKYWMPKPGDEARMKGQNGLITNMKRKVDERLAQREGYAPLLPQQAARVVHPDPGRYSPYTSGQRMFDSDSSDDSDAPSLTFHSADEMEDSMYERARRIGYAGFPNVDVSKEEAKRRRREEEEGILKGRWTRSGLRVRDGMGLGGEDGQGEGRRRASSATKSKNSSKSKDKGKGKAKWKGESRKVYGTWADHPPSVQRLNSSSSSTRNGNGHPADFDEVDDGGITQQRQGGAIQKQRSPPVWDTRTGTGMGMGVGSSFSPFSIGDDDDDDDDDEEHVKNRNSQGNKSVFPSHPDDYHRNSDSDKSVRPSTTKRLPPDAVDLVKEDQEAVEAARERERRRGEPQTNAPVHVYRKTIVHEIPETDSNASAMKRRGLGGKMEEIQEVYAHDPHVMTEDEIQTGVKEVVDHVETSVIIDPPKHAMSQDLEDNPWA
ncbi:conserved hypothetical protein [Cryptococcus gattii WM276]|uniref:DUF300-domain-containing protein n=1 Tax=Cryptococcus gattii serotype B (strain WM276 / ATCC MYA-4071) TaxID=367775 RepID=E6REC0_CRYGW|nr:uncharacterized protein CGB_L3370C [Cryptococcus gattii WM276]ADV25362.1 conserved hypothetical protein [Cryptococcus gattii WM276]